MRSDPVIDRYMGILCAIVWILTALVLMAWLSGCQSNQAPTPGQIATTQPASHPLNNVNQLVYRAQATLQPINIFAFIACLGGIGVLVYGAISADQPLEHVGLVVAIIAGTITLGTLFGMFALPFSPWIALTVFVGGAGYGAYLIYEKHIIAKAPTPVAK